MAINMIEEERYCVDVSNQVIAAQALLKSKSFNIKATYVPLCKGSI